MIKTLKFTLNDERKPFEKRILKTHLEGFVGDRRMFKFHLLVLYKYLYMFVFVNK